MSVLDINISSGGSQKSLDASKKFGVLIKPTLSGTLDSLQLVFYKYAGTTNNIVVELWSVASNFTPDSKIADLGTIAYADVDATYSFRTVTPASPPTLVAGTKYFIVFYFSGGSGNFATAMDAFTSTPSTQAYYNGSSWVVSSAQFTYRVYIDGVKTNYFETGNGVQISDTVRRATRFTAGDSGDLTKVAAEIYLYAGSKAAVNFEIWSDDGGDISRPSALIANGSLGRIPYTSLDASYSWRELIPSPLPALTNGVKYWIVLYKDNTDGSGNVAFNGGIVGNELQSRSTDGGSSWLYEGTYIKTYMTEEEEPTFSRNPTMLAVF